MLTFRKYVKSLIMKHQSIGYLSKHLKNLLEGLTILDKDSVIFISFMTIS